MILSNLQYFYCSYNQLSSLPNNMDFPNLKTFDCSYNLKTFSCTHTQLTSLPDKIN